MGIITEHIKSDEMNDISKYVIGKLSKQTI